ncbi:MAG: flavin reductase [Oscillospiraceae bacterium]|jgi:flavin reductase (DIM6/NTAB) family NADH-FMN oxidoreductase RutF|nr:flavin reductase [Oscillospiraceae bacterium]
MSFTPSTIEALSPNAVTLFRDTWGLLAAGSAEKCNTMTISWGMLGELWGADCVTVYVRPTRYTKEFLDANEQFTISFLPADAANRKIHGVTGAQSGRDVDKIALTGLTPVPAGESVAFAQAQTVLVCRKLAVQAFDPAGFVDDLPRKVYGDEDPHVFYVGKIEQVLVRTSA